MSSILPFLTQIFSTPTFLDPTYLDQVGPKLVFDLTNKNFRPTNFCKNHLLGFSIIFSSTSLTRIFLTENFFEPKIFLNQYFTQNFKGVWDKCPLQSESFKYINSVQRKALNSYIFHSKFSKKVCSKNQI